MRVKPPRFLARISLRLMLFNILVVFLPIAGVLFLGSYEKTMEQMQIESMERQAWLVLSATQDGRDVAPILHQLRPSDGRIRIVAPDGRVLADSGPLTDTMPGETPAQRNWLYRLGAAIVPNGLRRRIRPTPPLASSDDYERSPILRGPEVQNALVGTISSEKRMASDPDHTVTLYLGMPVYKNHEVTSVIVVSQTTDEIRAAIHKGRLAIFRVFLISFVVAMVLTMLVSTTIVQPIRQLRKDAHEILDASGRLRGRFKGSKKRDEIGDLARSLERLSRRLEERQKETESFASDISHEFKNPLASIRAAVEMLGETSSADDRTRFVRIAESEIARMERLLSQVRDLTRLDRTIAVEEKTEVDVAALLREVVAAFAMRERGRVTFEVDVAEPLTVNASRDRLVQLFSNLIENADSFAPHDTSIDITGRKIENRVVVSVADRGFGIPPENMSRIFDRFFTWRPEETSGRHAGLGLAIVRAIVGAYGGTVTAANRPDGGAVFEVRLPA
jgi:two-component system sensor histidine kinase ChvG